MPLIGNVLKPLAKNVLIPLGSTTAASATDAAIHKKMFGFDTTTLIISFNEKKLQEINQKEFRVEKIIKKKGDKLYVKWKVHDSSFNSCIDKKDIV